jgi:hypothetical protein
MLARAMHWLARKVLFGFVASLAQALEESVTVLVVLEDGLTPISAVHHVVNGTRILDSQFTRHWLESGKKGDVCQ